VLAIDGSLGSQRICLGVGLYQFSATFPLTASKIAIVGAGPGTTLQRSAGVDGIVASGNDITIEALTYDGAGTSMGYAIKATGDRFKCRGVNFTGFGPNMARGQVLIAKGAGDRWEDCNWLDSPIEHNLVVATDSGHISDLIIKDSHFSTLNNPNCVPISACTGLSMRGVPGGYIYSFEVSNLTYAGSGRALYMLLNANKPRTGTISGFTAELTGNTGNEMFGVWGCDGVTFTDFTGTDNNFGMANQPFFAFHDAERCDLKGYIAKLLNVGTQGFLALDSRQSSLSNCYIYGGGGNLNNAAGRGMVEAGMGAPGSSNSGFSIENCKIEMPAGATNSAVRGALGLAPQDQMNDLSLRGIKVTGTGAGTCFTLSTANGASLANALISDIHCSNAAVGVNIGSGVANAMIGNAQFRAVTAPIVNNGTGTVIK
jgi:hypothetical protein